MRRLIANALEQLKTTDEPDNNINLQIIGGVFFLSIRTKTSIREIKKFDVLANIKPLIEEDLKVIT